MTTTTITPDTLRTNPAALSHLMEFDHVIRVNADGTIDFPSIYGPSLYDGELDGDGWTLLDGYSGQDGYSGPLMHQSEFIGGRMALDILSTPGVYVALVNTPLEGDDDDDDDGEDEPTEWAVAVLDDTDVAAEEVTEDGVTLWVRRSGAVWETSTDGERFLSSPVSDAACSREGAIMAHLFYHRPRS